MDEEGEPPPELSLAWQCRKWHTLPEAGGLYEQDTRLMSRMNALLNVTDALSAMRNSYGESIHQLTNEQRAILGALQKMGLIFNG